MVATGTKPLDEARIEEIARNTAKQTVVEELAKAEAPLHLLEHTARGHALVVDPAEAERSPAKCFNYNGGTYCWVNGAIGLISSKENPEQYKRFCQEQIPANEKTAAQFRRNKERIEKAHEEWKKDQGGLAEWWEKVGSALGGE